MNTEATPLRVLIVEDDFLLAAELSDALLALGHIVDGQASSYEQAVASVAHQAPDLVLMDIRLQSDLDGIDAAMIIRSAWEVPVVFLTAHSDPATLERVREAAPYGFLLKPFDDKQLGLSIDLAVRLHRTHTALEASRARFALAEAGSDHALWDYDVATGACYFSERFIAWTGGDLSCAQTFGSWLELMARGDRARVASLVARHLESSDDMLRLRYRLVCADGVTRWIEATARIVRDTRGAALRLAGSQTRLRHLDLPSAGPGVADRPLFEELVRWALDDHAGPGSPRVAVVLFEVLRRGSTAAGSLDAVAPSWERQVVRRLSTFVRARDGIANLGGGVFGLLVTRVPDEKVASELAVRVVEDLSRPLVNDGLLVRVTARAGVAMGRAFEPAANCIQRAMEALGVARDSEVMGHTPQVASEARQGDVVASRLGLALQTGELELHFQPVIALATGQCVAVEALARWSDPELGQIGPGVFVPIAEREGLAQLLLSWSLESTLALLQSLRDTEWQHLRCNLNVSAACLTPSLPERVRGSIESFGIAPSSLCLELTETSASDIGQAAVDTLEAIRTLGVAVSLDDFGTGYSSLAHLTKLPFHELKIDRSFVAGMRDGEPTSTLVVETVIGLARQLGVGVVAEGVETPAQMRYLRELGCDVAQGWLVSRALPAEALMDFLASWSPERFLASQEFGGTE